MGRWEPNARGRLARAALVLSAERGFENTTVAEIAAAAGVTERTFYRHFPDKADALFPDNAYLLGQLAGVAADAARAGSTAPGRRPRRRPPSRHHRLRGARAGPAQRQGDPHRAGTRRSRPGASTADRGRRRRGARLVRRGPLDARLAAETALAVWRVAVTEWVRDPAARPLPDVVAATADAMRSL